MRTVDQPKNCFQKAKAKRELHIAAFYQLCWPMETDYHPLEFDQHCYLTYLEASRLPLWSTTATEKESSASVSQRAHLDRFALHLAIGQFTHGFASEFAGDGDIG